jgi:alpha-ribazole phosphatase
MDPRRTVVYLLRHGDVALGEPRRFIGHLDVPLSPLGERQAAVQAERLRAAPLAAVFCSDLTRARRTAEIIAAPHGLEPAVTPALREMDMGRWDGLSAAELTAREPVALAEWMARIAELPIPGGESVGDLAERAWPAFEALVRAHAGRCVAVVAHGGTNRVLLCRALGLPLGRLLAFGQDYAGLSVLERRGARWSLGRLNEGPMR